MAWLAAELPPDIPPACIVRAAEQYSLPPEALVALLKQENGSLGKAYPRKTGTYFGPFQISDKWLGHVSKWGVTAHSLQHDACTNVGVGAYVLAYYKIREGDSWFRAIARYNVGSLDTPERREAGFRYATKVMSHWWSIYKKWGGGA